MMRLLLTLLLLACAKPSLAAQSYDNCTGFIRSLPATISTQGTWCMDRDLASSVASGAVITIATNNVTLDCNDFKIGGLGAGLTTMARGIVAVERTNITVRNCAIRGFYWGVQLNGGSGHLIEHNRLDGNTWIGMAASGDGTVIRSNRIVATGGSTVATYPSRAIGIYTSGDVDVLDNTLSGVVAAVGSNGYAVAIMPWENTAGTLRGNNIKNVIADGTGWSYGISFASATSGRAIVTDNVMVGLSHPQSAGVWCSTTNQIVVERNVVHGFNSAHYSCLYPGQNTHIP